MAWYRWKSQLEFDVWHDAACAEEGLPRPGVNQSTGQIDVHAAWTTALARPTVVADDDVRAQVHSLVPSNATPCDPPPSLDME